MNIIITGVHHHLNLFEVTTNACHTENVYTTHTDCLQNAVPVLGAIVRSSPTKAKFNVSSTNVNPAAIIRISYYTNTKAGFDQVWQH